MKVYLAYPDRDLDVEAVLPPNVDELTGDLGVGIILDAMAAGDKYLRNVALHTLFATLTDGQDIKYRQAVLSDCLAHPDVVRELYGLALTALEQSRKDWLYSSQYPESVLRHGISVLGSVLVQLRRLRDIALEQAPAFQSDGFRRMFAELTSELDEPYLRSIEGHLRRLQFRRGVRLSATFGSTNATTDYVLRRRVQPFALRERIGFSEADSQTFELDPRDMAGAEELTSLRGRGIALAAEAVGRSTDHVLGYFAQLRAEVGFYLGSLNLHDKLTAKGEPTCMPELWPAGEVALVARGLYDPSLSLAIGSTRVVGSDIDAAGKSLIMITGANRGGKSTFLRSIGLAQLLMQAGMFVPAESLTADIRRKLFTHFKREEDSELRRGKFDEELARMSSIVDDVGPGDVILMNESFSATNELEGSDIGSQIVRALMESGIKVAYVTHMFHLADGLNTDLGSSAAFMRAERLPDGQRTFKLLAGEPLPTSYGQDIYRRIFEDDLVTAVPTAAMDPVAHN